MKEKYKFPRLKSHLLQKALSEINLKKIIFKPFCFPTFSTKNKRKLSSTEKEKETKNNLRYGLPMQKIKHQKAAKRTTKTAEEREKGKVTC